MKAYKIKKTLVQEFVSFGETRQDAIDNFLDSQGHDFDSVTINGEIHTNGEVLSSKVTATSMGTNNLIVFSQKDWKFAKAMWLRNHKDRIRIKEYDGTITPAKDVGVSPGGETTDEITEIRDRYTGRI